MTARCLSEIAHSELAVAIATSQEFNWLECPLITSRDGGLESAFGGKAGIAT
jgi:hypothetical protein